MSSTSGSRSPAAIPTSTTSRRTSLSTSDLRELAAQAGIRPSKALGQNFLADPNLARAIVADARVQPGDRILEIGAGLGSLTLPLAAAGGDVLAVEFDRGLVPVLRDLAQGEGPGSIQVLEADATKLDWRQTLDGDGWLMVSNLPYNVATPLLLGMLEAHAPIERYLVMVQTEVGERLVAGPGDDAYGTPSVRVAFHANARIVRRIPPDVFWPEPTITSVMVELTPREAPVATPEDAVFEVVSVAFAQRRKTMRSALRRLRDLSVEQADAILARAGVDPQARPGTLDLPAFAAIADALAEGAA